MIYGYIDNKSYKIDENSKNGQYFIRGIELDNIEFKYTPIILENPDYIIDEDSDTEELCSSNTIFNAGFIDCGGENYTETIETIDCSDNVKSNNRFNIL